MGTGVTGCATAYCLAREGAKVTVAERDAIGICASGYALGLLNPLLGTGITVPNEALVNDGFRTHRDLWSVPQEEAVDIQVRMMPHLELFLGQDGADNTWEEMSGWLRAEGFSSQWLSCDEVLRLEPRVAPEVEVGSGFSSRAWATGPNARRWPQPEGILA